DSKCPIITVTNGIHMPTWIAADMARLFERHLKKAWRAQHDAPHVWGAIVSIPDEDLWAVREALPSYLIAFMGARARELGTATQVPAAGVVASGPLLDPAALPIGFARRFTDYKRPELIFYNPERLAHILTAFRRPVQIVFAGKAHPADHP